MDILNLCLMIGCLFLSINKRGLKDESSDKEISGYGRT